MINLCEDCRQPCVGTLCPECLPPDLDDVVERTRRGVALCRLALAEVRARQQVHA